MSDEPKTPHVRQHARVLAEVTSAAELLGVWRRRADELSMTRLELDHVSGLQSGYSSKLLCVPPIKGFGSTSFGLMNGALGLKILVVEDTEQTAKILAIRTPRERPVRKKK